jgi:pimeloyl-ACP methyl ester carboxylesterase
MSFREFEQKDFFNLGCTIRYWHKKALGEKYIFFLHGGGCDHRMFEKQIDVIDSYFDVIVWDARGHGLSKLDTQQKFVFADMISDILKLFEIHNIEKAVFVGQSMGGNLAQEIAYYYPEKVSGLVLADCTKNTQKLGCFEKITLKLFPVIFYAYPWKTLVRQSADACGKNEHTKNYVAECLENIERAKVLDIMMSLFSCLREDKQFRFKQPTLLVFGEKDNGGNIKKIMKIWAKNDNMCKLHIIKNAGHCSNMDNPEKFNKVLVDFLKDIEE